MKLENALIAYRGEYEIGLRAACYHHGQDDAMMVKEVYHPECRQKPYVHLIVSRWSLSLEVPTLADLFLQSEIEHPEQIRLALDSDEWYPMDNRKLYIFQPQPAALFWPTVFDCIQSGLESNPAKVREYAQLLLIKLPSDGLEAKYLEKMLEGEQGRQIGIPEDILPGLRSKMQAEKLREQIANEIRHQYDGRLYRYFGKAEVFIEGGPGATGPGFCVVAYADGDAVGEARVNSAEQWAKVREQILRIFDQDEEADDAAASAAYDQAMYEQGQYTEDYTESVQPRQQIHEPVVPPEDLP